MSRKAKIREKKIEDYCCYDFFGERAISRAIFLLNKIYQRDVYKRLTEYLDAMFGIMTYDNKDMVDYSIFRYLEKCFIIFKKLTNNENPVIKDICRGVEYKLNILRANLDVENIFVKCNDIDKGLYLSRILFDRWFFDEVNVLVRTDDKVIYERNRKDLNIIVEEIKNVAKSPYDTFYKNNWKWKYHSILEEELRF